MYCGPAALCAITHNPYEDVRTAINQYRGRKLTTGVLGLSSVELRGAMRILDVNHSQTKYPMDNPKTGRPPTLAAFLKNRKDDEMTRPLVIQLTGHYVVVKGRKFIDNHTIEPVFIRKAPHRRRRVVRYWIIG